MSRSSAEAEYRALATSAAEITWISFLLRDLQVQLPQAPQLFSDNISALYMTINPVFHSRSKHIAIDYHFVREKVALGSLITRFVRSIQQLADILTKPLSKRNFKHLRDKLGIRSTSPSSLKKGIEETQLSTPHMHH